jgi:hypothetical protein
MEKDKGAALAWPMLHLCLLWCAAAECARVFRFDIRANFLFSDFMQNPTTQAITGLLLDWSKGDEATLAQLLPVVYQELHKLAQIYLGKEHPGHTLQPTALIHEAYLRLIQQNIEHWESRAHFYGVAARRIAPSGAGRIHSGT